MCTHTHRESWQTEADTCSVVPTGMGGKVWQAIRELSHQPLTLKVRHTAQPTMYHVNRKHWRCDDYRPGARMGCSAFHSIKSVVSQVGALWMGRPVGIDSIDTMP